MLPKADLILGLAPDGPLRRAGANLVYDEVNADFRGLDDKGGTYVQGLSPPATLRIFLSGLEIQAAHAMAFTYSPRNVNGPPYGSASGAQLFSPCNSPVWPVPDLRNFFLVILDARDWVVSLTAVRTVPGEQLEPTCSPFPINSPRGP